MMTTDSPLNPADVKRADAHADARVFGALALELAAGSDAGRDALPQREAGALAALLARDLAGHDADAAEIGRASCRERV